MAAEIRSRGGNLGLISCLDILQDPRWGRSEECYSEDPYLASKMTEAATIVLHGNSKEDLKSNNKVVAVLKHLCAQGASIGGHNGKGVSLGEREIREIHLPAAKAGIQAGAMGCMAAYNEIDGIYCHGNRKLLTEILSDEWGFDGIVMSDGCAIDNLCKVTGEEEFAAAMALIAGVDLNLWSNACTKLEDTVSSGKVSGEFIDRAVRRILRLKFMLGLFDNAYTDETLALGIALNENSKNINLNIARESVVLLKNNKGILPLRKDLTRIAELAKAIVATGTSVVVILIQGRPHAIPWIAEHCDAILCGWYPGKEGGRAIGEILFVNVNPSGKLPVSIPKSSAQLPVYYNHKDISDYIDMTIAPLYTFGFGLSYTTFELSNLKIHNPEISVDALEKKQTIIISIEVTNTGKIAGECKVVTLKIGKEELSVWNVDMKFVIEQGNVKIMIGNSSIKSLEKMIKITP